MPLPPWATIHLDKNVNVRKDWEPTTAKTEELFRQRSVRYWSERLDQAQQMTWEDISRNELERFQDFCRTGDDDDDIANDTTDSKASGPTTMPQQFHNDENSNIHDNNVIVPYHERFALEPSTDYPFDLLPCLIINPPPSCKLDRQALMQSIYLQVMKQNNIVGKKKSRRSATILLPRLLPRLSQTLALVWRQIIHQEPNKSLSRFASKRLNRNRRTQSLQKWIIWWASRTEHFDQLVILLEDPGGFAETEVRQDFYRCMANWRKEKGLPLSLIVMGTQEQVRDLCPLDTRIQILSPNVQTKWICQFLSNLMLSQLPPPMQWSNIVTTLLEDFQYHDGSCTKFVQEFRAHVIHFFAATKGSFAWDLRVDQDRWHLMAWFCAYEGAKEYLENTNPGSEKYKALDQCVRMQEELQHYWKGMILGLPLFLQFGKNESETKIEATGAIPCLALLYKWIQERTDNDSDLVLPLKDLMPLQQLLDPNGQIKEITFATSGKPAKAIKTLIQELIILIHAYDGKSEQAETSHVVDKEIINSNLISMIQELCNLIGEQIDSWVERWMEECPLLVIENNMNLKMNVCIRRETIEDLPQPAKSMYELLQDRLSIKREDWFYDFGGTVDDFTMGVWMLTVSGLVQCKRIRGGGILYEKVAVVWTS
ncbi:unnamed protein product [Cylindrotheca closterium]|uniref:Uncharacterized protein n=1 Tax=Cylindrotheca closterium TaxID=2856 RepID=A0AAD2FZU1_9STRA|nr:unnamed protein product [Cylindrotheca closterium]